MSYETQSPESDSRNNSLINRFLGKITSPFRYNQEKFPYWPTRSDGSIVHLAPTMTGKPLTPEGEMKVAGMIRAELRAESEESLGDVR